MANARKATFLTLSMVAMAGLYTAPGIASELVEVDCAKPQGELANLICTDSDLLARNQEMNTLLTFAGRSIRKNKPGIELDKSQELWTARRVRCMKSYQKKKCLMNLYNSRLAYLEAKFRPGNTRTETRECIEGKGTIFLTYGKTAFTEFVTVGRDLEKTYNEWFMAATGKKSGESVQYTGEDDKGSQATVWVGPKKANFIWDRKKYGLVCEK